MFSPLFSRSDAAPHDATESQTSFLPVFPWYAQMGVAALSLLVLFGMRVGGQGTEGEVGTKDHFHRASDGQYALAQADADGEEIYNTRCMSCHQMNGKGVTGTFPPLSETKWVNGDKGRLIRILLHGITGPIEVKGTKYSGVMPPWGGALSNEEIAALSTYIRSNFGNDSSPITTEEVKKVREATEGRKKPWTAKELKKEANQGIPGDSTASG